MKRVSPPRGTTSRVRTDKTRKDTDPISAERGEELVKGSSGNQPSGRTLSNRQAAKRLGITPSTLDRMRSRGTSPAFFKTGRRVNYLEDVIEQYIAKNSFGSTSEYPKGWKFPGRRPPSDEPDDPVYA